MISTLRLKSLEQAGSRSARGAAGTFVLTATFAGLSFIISILLARWMGVEGYGTYAYAMAWVTFLITPALCGLDTLIVRQVAVYITPGPHESWSLTRGILSWAARTVLLAGAVLATVVAGGALLLLREAPEQRATFLIALLLVPVMALARLRQAILRGFRDVLSGLWPETLVQPLLLLCFLGTAYFLSGRHLTPPGAMGLNVLATVLAFTTGAFVLRRRLPQQVMEHNAAREVEFWLRSAGPLLTLSLLHIFYAQIDTLALGAIKGVKAAGIYSMAKWLSGVIGLVVTAVNAVLAPSAASLYKQGNITGLQNTVTRSARALLFLSLPLTVFLMLCGTPILRLGGAEFERGHIALVLLCIGQLVNAAMGSVGLLLMMTGHEREAAKGIGYGALANGVLSALLIPRWGIEGAAVAASLSLILWNLVLAAMVQKNLHIHSTAFYAGEKVTPQRENET